ncbi:iron-sulfur cluster assembly protein [Azospirillum isscasi]|uniref:Iron-sulfur cluster assembly protein n=1 Tax=Azospirillum isscasi TaxID=3053926 RepID=A0ABU0WIE3_9PROT|nr:iron-sulfur cluster assembly protein [Azospirillum isscasi]MDQ2103985.1 iron-sulfur cluster assembly protein [Azospirillum isscasi]
MPDDAISKDGEAEEAKPMNQTEAAIAAAKAAYDPRAALSEAVISALKSCYDPEIPVDIWELGLIYRVDIGPNNEVEIDMTLTSPMCPVAGELPMQVQQAVASVEDVTTCKVELVWEPPWHQGMMSEVARVQLDMF